MSLRRRSLVASFAATIIALSRQLRAQELAYESFTVPSGNYPTSLIGAQTVSHGFAGPWSVSDPSAASAFTLQGPQVSPPIAGVLGSNASAAGQNTNAWASRSFDLSSPALQPYLAPDHQALGAPNTTLWIAFSVETTPDASPWNTNIDLIDNSNPQSPEQAIVLNPANYSAFTGNQDFNYPADSRPPRGSANLFVYQIQYATNSTKVSFYRNPPASSITPNPTPDGAITVLPGTPAAPDGLLRITTVSFTPGTSDFETPPDNISRISNLRVGASYTDVAPSNWSLPAKWQGDAPGNYFDPTRWSGPIPDGVDAEAVFGPFSSPRTITLDQTAHLAKLTFDSDNPYTITGQGAIDHAATNSGPPYYDRIVQPRSIQVLRGSHTIDTALAGSGVNDVSIAKGAFLTVKAINPDGNFSDYTVRGGGTLTVNTVGYAARFYRLHITDNSTLSYHIPQAAAFESYPSYFLGNSTIDPGSQLLLSAQPTPGTVFLVARFNDGYGTTFINSGLIRLNPPESPGNAGLAIQFQSTPNLNFNPTNQTYAGTIDITSNALFLLSGDIASLRSMVASAYANGAWTGTGITSSLAGAQGPTGAETLAVVAVRDFPVLAPFLAPTYWDNPLDAAAVIYTYLGDTNLDGIVDVLDFANLRAGLASQGAFSGWSHGDFNYDGLIDQSDFALFQQGYASQSTPLGLAALIPEPSLPVFAFTPLFALLRRATPRWAQQK